MFILEKTQYLKWACKKDGDRLFSRTCCDSTRDNGLELKEGRFRLDIWKKYFALRVVKHWKSLPREMVDAPSLETIQGEVVQGSKQPDLVKDVSAGEFGQVDL